MIAFVYLRFLWRNFYGLLSNCIKFIREFFLPIEVLLDCYISFVASFTEISIEIKLIFIAVHKISIESIAL